MIKRPLAFLGFVSLVVGLVRVPQIASRCCFTGNVKILSKLNDMSTMRLELKRESSQEETTTLFSTEQTRSVSDNLDELTEAEDSELIQRLNQEIFSEMGVELEQLINPSKVVNLERDLIKLERQKLQLTNQGEIEKIDEQIAKKKSTSAIERRSIMQGWLKNLFIFQSVLSGVASLGMVYNSIPGYEAPLPIQVLGFWMWWLFIVPSLRARKPSNEEKKALNIAFLVTPLVSFALPTITRDCPTIWWANAAAVVACYAYAFLLKTPEPVEAETSGLPPLLAQIFKALDYGSGQERGARK